MRKQRAVALLLALESIATGAQPGLMFASLTIGHHILSAFLIGRRRRLLDQSFSEVPI
jgi:hypothetical protein